MSRAPSRLGVDVLLRRGRAPVAPLEIRRLVREAGACVGATVGEVAVILTGDAEIRRLNRRFRRKDRPTDVLSFPDGHAEPYRPVRLGDIVISIPAARRNARRAGRTLRHEVSALLVHGLLHLAGYDHEVDGGEMKALEEELRRRLIPGAPPAGG